MKRSGDSTHHFWSPKPTLNDCVLTLSTGTQSSEQEYSHLTASNSHPSTPYSQNITPSFPRGTRPYTLYTFPRSTKHVCESLACSQDFLKNLLASRNFLCSATAATKTRLSIIQLWFNYFHGIVAYTLLGSMGVGRIFSRGGGTRGFFLNFSRVGPKVVKFDFSHSKVRKQPFFAYNFKIQWGPSPPFWLPCLGGIAKRDRSSWFIHSGLPFVYVDHQFANLSAPFQNAMPLDTHESAKSSSFPSSLNSISIFSQLDLSSGSAAASYWCTVLGMLSPVQSQNIPTEKLCSIRSGEVPMLTKGTHHDEIFCFQ